MAIQVLLTAHLQEHFLPATSVSKAQPCSSSSSQKKEKEREKEKRKDGSLEKEGESASPLFSLLSRQG